MKLAAALAKLTTSPTLIDFEAAGMTSNVFSLTVE